MRQVADATRLDAPTRARRLLEFNNRLRTNTESVQVFREWQMNLSPELVKIEARVMDPEVIIFQGDRVRSENADWTQPMRNQTFHKTATLGRHRWHVVVARQHMGDAQNFVRTLQKAVGKMGFYIETPV